MTSIEPERNRISFFFLSLLMLLAKLYIPSTINNKLCFGTQNELRGLLHYFDKKVPHKGKMATVILINFLAHKLKCTETLILYFFIVPT